MSICQYNYIVPQYIITHHDKFQSDHRGIVCGDSPLTSRGTWFEVLFHCQRFPYIPMFVCFNGWVYYGKSKKQTMFVVFTTHNMGISKILQVFPQKTRFYR